MSNMLDGVKQIIIVLSGKGGVGKSTVSTQIALSLRERGFHVGLLDVDICGPSIPFILNLEDKSVYQSEEGWVPIFADLEQKLAVMSVGFLLKSRTEGVIWRGPKKTALISQFLTQVLWRRLDFLVIDTPPGTTDEHISVMENLRNFRNKGAVIVTTPQAVAIEDVQKEITFCRKFGVPIHGILENMSGFICPFCSECTNVFSSGGGETLAALTRTNFLGRLPLDPKINELVSSGESLMAVFPDTDACRIMEQVVDKLIDLDSDQA